MAGAPDSNIEYTIVAAPSSPINTPASSPTTLSLSVLNNVYLWKVNIRIPPGHAGYTGIALVDSGTPVLPQSGGTSNWIVGDDDDLWFPYLAQTGQNIQLWTYNTSTDYSHGWQVRFIYTPVVALDQGNDVIVTPDVADWAQAIEGTTGGS